MESTPVARGVARWVWLFGMLAELLALIPILNHIFLDANGDQEDTERKVAMAFVVLVLLCLLTHNLLLLQSINDLDENNLDKMKSVGFGEGWIGSVGEKFFRGCVFFLFATVNGEIPYAVVNLSKTVDGINPWPAEVWFIGGSLALAITLLLWDVFELWLGKNRDGSIGFLRSLRAQYLCSDIGAVVIWSLVLTLFLFHESIPLTPMILVLFLVFLLGPYLTILVIRGTTYSKLEMK